MRGHFPAREGRNHAISAPDPQIKVAAAAAAGAVEHPGRAVKAIVPEDPVQHQLLLPGGGLPILKELFIMRRQTVVKCLRDVRRGTSFRGDMDRVTKPYWAAAGQSFLSGARS